MSDHSPIAPSSAHIWGGGCPGSVTLRAAYPQAPTEKSEEGDRAHRVAFDIATGVSHRCEDDEMLEAAELYVETIRASGVPGTALHFEERVAAPTMIHPDNWGTPDAWAFHDEILYVWDFKYGHRFVDEFENLQLVNYVAAIVETHNLSPRRCILTIVQPRCYYRGRPVRTWQVEWRDMAAYIDALSAAATVAMSGTGELKPGGYCGDCEARHACPALQLAAYDAAELSGLALPVELDPETLGRELTILKRAAEMLEARLTGLETQALAEIKSGRNVPGWTAESKDGPLRWNADVSEAVLQLGDLMGVDLRKPGLITPTQAIKAGIDGAVISEYASRKRGEAKLVPLDTRDTRRIFKKD